MKIKIERRKWKVYWFFEKHLLFQGRIPSSSEQWGSPGIVRKWYQLLLISNFTSSLCLPRQIWQTIPRVFFYMSTKKSGVVWRWSNSKTFYFQKWLFSPQIDLEQYCLTDMSCVCKVNTAWLHSYRSFWGYPTWPSLLSNQSICENYDFSGN